MNAGHLTYLGTSTLNGTTLCREANLQFMATLNFGKLSSAAYHLQLLTPDGKLNETYSIQIAK